MARNTSKSKQEQPESQPEVEAEKTKQPESAAQPEAAQQARPEKETATKTKGRMVDATLKTRHCRGGICKEAGETMRITQGEYDRLKKYDRVE